MRMERASANAARLAAFLERRVPRVAYPGLAAHPHHGLAMRQMRSGGSMVALWLDGGRAQAHALLDALRLIDISNNLGDARTMMTHPFTTTHTGVPPEARLEMGITEGMLRLSVGIEDGEDLLADLDQALGAAGL